MMYKGIRMTGNNKTVKWKSNRRGRIAASMFSNLTLVFGMVIVAILVGLVIILNTDAIPAFKQFGLSFIGSSTWDPVKESFGALPAIFGTLLTSIIGLIIAVPISFGAAIFLVELAPP
jgi:phosphate transport system permease protein